MKKRVLALLTALALTLSLPVFAAAPAAADEMRGAWVSSVYNLDYPFSPTTDAAALRQQADGILNGAQGMGLNAIFLQVRPSSDALYPSKLFPWSEYLTGKQGTAPSDSFDPLQYWIDGAHARGLELHAWINPYRITKGKDTEWNALSSSNPAKQHPEWVVKYSDGNYYYDPGLPAVRQLVKDGVAEIIDLYPEIDGIHFDDYFYPGTDFNDNATFAAYGGGTSSADDWRRENVNTLVRELDTLIHQKDPALSFGISPSGVWANKSENPRGSDTRGGNPSYSRAYADTLAWIAEGTVDYVCPQIYWYIGQSAADYSILAKWWSDAVRGSDVKLYIGEAAYKCDAKDAGDVWKGTTELIKHLQLCENQPEVDGHIFFRYGSFNEVTGLAKAVTSYYAAKPAQQPAPPQAEKPQTNNMQRTTQYAGLMQTLSLFVQSILR